MAQEQFRYQWVRLKNGNWFIGEIDEEWSKGETVWWLCGHDEPWFEKEFLEIGPKVPFFKVSLPDS